MRRLAAVLFLAAAVPPSPRRLRRSRKSCRYSDRLEDDIIFADGAFIQAPRVSQHKD